VAGTIVTGGSISTEEVVPDERQIDMDDRIRRLRPDESQFTTMTDKTPSRTAMREKVNWLEEDDFPRQVTAAAGIATGVTALPLTAGQGKIVAARDVLRNMRTGEGMTVVSVATDTVTVTRQTGNIAQAAVNAGDVFLVVADAQAQGSDFPAPRYLARVLGYNYTQITRTTWSFTGTQTAIELYGGREPGKEAVRKAREHKRKWEAIGFFGARSYQAAVAPDNDPQGTAGGAIEFIVTNVKDIGAVALTPAFFDTFVSSTLPYGDPGSKVLFASPVLVQNMSVWVRTGMGSQWTPTPQNVYGVKVDAFISGAFGYKLPVVVKTEWAEFPVANKGYGGYGFLLDMSLIQQVPLRDRDTKLLTEQQPKGKDVYSAEYFREATYEFAQEKAHGVIMGAIAPT
jgi:Family of unknown function (DUF5309)